MKNSTPTDPWEDSLVAWRPRLPSPNLKTRIFDRTVSTASPDAAAVTLWSGWRWLAPGFACLLVMVVALSPRGDRLGYLGSPNTNFFAAVARKQEYAAYISAAHHNQTERSAR